MREGCLVAGEGFQLRVVDSPLWRARLVDGELEVTLPLLRADATASVVGERLAAPLMLPHELRGCPESLASRLAGVVEAYRRRVVVEQLYDLAVRMGPLVSEALVDPFYPLYSRLRLLARIAPCPARLRGADELRASYLELSRDVASVESGLLRLRTPSLRLEFKALASRVRATLLSISHRIPVPRTPWEGRECDLDGVFGGVSRLVRMPEGIFAGFCEEEPLSILGEGDCRPLPRFSSAYLCVSGSRRVIVKDYMKMAIKWLPAAIASSVAVRYRLGPRSRLAAEYKYLRLFREVVDTPRIVAVCSDIARAASSREYVEGQPVLASKEPGHWRLAGEVLGRLHEAGYVMGDSNPGNVIVDLQGLPWIVDAEQARRFSLRGAAWDIVVALSYSGLFDAEDSLLLEMLRGYAGSWSGSLKILELASSPALWLPMRTVPKAYSKRRILRDFVSGKRAG